MDNLTIDRNLNAINYLIKSKKRKLKKLGFYLAVLIVFIMGWIGFLISNYGGI